MIYKLSKDKLKELGYNDENIKSLFDTNDISFLQCNNGNVCISILNNEIYTDLDFYKKIYFEQGTIKFPYSAPELFNEYFELTLNEFFEKQRKELKNQFIENTQFQKFIKSEKLKFDKIVNTNKKYIEQYNQRIWTSKERVINITETYIDFLNDKLLESQQNNKLHFDTIEQLVNHYENEALSIDLKDEASQLYNVLQSQKLKANEVENEDELNEVKDFCTKAVASLKHKLSLVIINENYKVKANFIQSYVFDIRLYFEYKELVNKLNNKKESLKIGAKPQQSENNDLRAKPLKDYKNFIWFKTGILLATGQAYDLYNKYKKDKGHFTKISLELGFKDTDRPYFSSTINNNKNDKNTFDNKDKLQKLHKHLTENGLNFGAEFLKKYNQIEST